MKKETVGNCNIHLGDCMDFMAEVPDQHYDLAIVDPPYFSGPNKSGYYGKGYSNLGVKRAKHYDSLNVWEVPQPDYFAELFRVSKNQIIWGANHFAENFNSSSSCWIVWDKDNGKSSFADAELAYTSFSTAVRIFKYRWSGMLQGYHGNKNLNQKRIHPTQKPIELYRWLLNLYAQKDFKILDTHLGSGSHAVACNQLGVELDAIELDACMFNKSLEWIREEFNHKQEVLAL